MSQRVSVAPGRDRRARAAMFRALNDGWKRFWWGTGTETHCQTTPHHTTHPYFPTHLQLRSVGVSKVCVFSHNFDFEVAKGYDYAKTGTGCGSKLFAVVFGSVRVCPGELGARGPADRCADTSVPAGGRSCCFPGHGKMLQLPLSRFTAAVSVGHYLFPLCYPSGNLARFII